MKKIIGIISVTILTFNTSLANAFKFDIWESGMDIKQIIMIAENNNIKISGGETLYSYNDNLLNKKASISLELTRGDYKLMRIKIKWQNDYENFNEFYKILIKIIEDKNPVSKIKNIMPIFTLMNYNCLYMLDKNNSVEIRDPATHPYVEMIYTDIPLENTDKKRKEWDKKESQRKAVLQDINKFNPEKESSYREQDADSGKIRKWTDDRGVNHYSNIESGENSTVVTMKPVETVPLKEILWYEVRLKNGSKIKAKKIDRVSKGVLAIVERGIKTEVADNKISQVEETSKVGGKIHTELRSLDSF
ncbi:hypothetical protein [Candidatus Electronema sp. JM]|uniref:hypothetical protein n=1 Tax=Candidatus Electronema sp. JM TaxID=3401571 RepID=UPI003AA7EE5E